MTSPLLQTNFLSSFTCLGDKCEDTCCKGWGMQVDAATVTGYLQGIPELMDAITTGEAELIMKRAPKTDYCVKYEAGWCGIHKKYGTNYLGDACHFFPRVTRKLGDTAIQSASLSCPEVARLALFGNNPFEIHSETTERLPHTLRDYLPAALTTEQAVDIHQSFITAAGAADATAERILCRIHSVAQSLESLDITTWPAATAFYLKSADGRLPPSESQPSDAFNLLYALAGLVAAAQKSARPRLETIITDIENALAIAEPACAGEVLSISTTSLERNRQMQVKWQEASHTVQPLLKRWLQAQLSNALFPFAGFGDTLAHRIAIIAIRFATLKLALMAELSLRNSLSEEAIIRIAQSLARFMDHLADPTLSLKIYTETDWLKPARLRGLLGDN